MFREAELTGELLAGEHPRGSPPSPRALQRMERAAGRLGRPEAARELADVCAELVDARAASRREDRWRPADDSTRPRAVSLFKTRHAAQVHFVGIGGIGMSGIAEVLLNLGYRCQRLGPQGVGDHPAAGTAGRAAGDRPPGGEPGRRPTWWSSPRPSGATTPRSLAAQARKIPVIPRAEMLAELMRLKYAVAVAGSPRQDHHHLHGGARC